MSVFGAYSRYYNLFYRDKDYAGEAAYVESLVRKHHPSAESLLDLGCGTGNHAFLLSGMGLEVAGVDFSAEMLAEANARAAALASQPSSLNPHPIFHQGDIRSIRLGRRFDVVVSLFHVMSYQTTNADLREAMATAREHLQPGGLFIFDCWYGPAVLTDRPAVRVKRLEDEEIAVTRIAEPQMFPNENLVEVKYQVLVKEKASGAVEELRELHRMRYLFRPELELMLEQAGLRLVDSLAWMTESHPGFDSWGACFVAECK